MRGIAWMIAGLLLVMTGCSGLILRDDDSMAETTGKVAARTIMAIPSLLASEIVIGTIQQNEQRAASQAQYQDWFDRLSPEQQERELDRQNARQIARTQAAGFAMLGGGLIRPYVNHHSYTQAPMMAPSMPRNCLSNMTGASMTTQCY